MTKKPTLELSRTQQEKKIKKEEERRKRYMNTMISRKEAFELVEDYTQALREQLQLAHIQISTLSRVLIESELTTEEGLDEKSKEIISKIYNKEEGDKDGKTEHTK